MSKAPAHQFPGDISSSPVHRALPSSLRPVCLKLCTCPQDVYFWRAISLISLVLNSSTIPDVLLHSCFKFFAGGGGVSPGLNLGPETDYSDRSCSWFSSVPPGKRRCNTLKLGSDLSHPYLFTILQFDDV
jgi:hypothetical protein